MEETFQRMIEDEETSLKEQNKMFNVIGYSKLIFAGLFFVSVYNAFTRGTEHREIVLAVIEFVILLFLWHYQAGLRERMMYSEGMIAINKRHLERLSGKWTQFPDIGEEFIDRDHPYACDLDVVGNKSLFQLLNTTHTWYGRQLFAKNLLYPDFTASEICKRQQAIVELSKDIKFTNEVEYETGKIGADEHSSKLVDALTDKTLFMKNRQLKRVISAVPFLSIAGLMIIAIIHPELFLKAAIGCWSIQIVIWILGVVHTQAYLRRVYNLPYLVSAYRNVWKRMIDKEFTSEKLIEIKECLKDSDVSAIKAIKDLEIIAECISVRSNVIIYFVLNALFLWDYQCVFLLERWKENYADHAKDWFLALGEIESLICFANLPRVCSQVSLPTIEESRKVIKAKKMGHPLIQNEVRVTNDVGLDEQIFIISGSNMSGKTTFLRTIGINLVLAQSGSLVCAEQMNFAPMKIMTSMRIADDLNEGISTFYAELKRIKGIIELAKNEEQVLFLIDEIFRGTNSVDRLTGAREVILQLNAYDAIGMITTHDLELCELEKHTKRIWNYSFSESYQDRKIIFDYKLKAGRSTTTNAKYLMDLIGITK
ncbi:MutS-related protein, family 1 [Lachnospiraceae bacterium KM106-2]|nr:MutS-related protein, family 1 [Lachnospiraceae bacterium KM106-2]